MELPVLSQHSKSALLLLIYLLGLIILVSLLFRLATVLVVSARN